LPNFSKKDDTLDFRLEMASIAFIIGERSINVIKTGIIIKKKATGAIISRIFFLFSLSFSTSNPILNIKFITYHLP
jgi:hypothetical protein